MTRRIVKPTLAIPIAALLTLPIHHSHADTLPLWEAGIGVGALSLPDYRGSDVRDTYVLPVPYFIYRGEFLKADRNGVRGTLFSSNKVEVNVSLNATLPVNSRNNPARRGMADLKPTVEIGPTLDVNLWNSADRQMKLDFRAPLRTAVTVESSPKSIGWLFSPNLNLDIRNPAGLLGWHLGMLAGPVFANRKYNTHFYSVTPADATAVRPAYSASGGYSGSQFTIATSKRFRHYWVGAFMRYDTLAGAVFEDSPLVKKRSAVSAGFAVSWVFGESSTLVNVEKDVER
jgi:outer membrane scaffolding protein for murein synthesis (MipA/OmpV family)